MVREAGGDDGGQLLLGRVVAGGNKALDSSVHCYCNVHGSRKVRDRLEQRSKDQE